MSSLTLSDILEREDVLSTLQKSCNLNKQATEVGFLVQIKHRDLTQIKVNAPISMQEVIIDLDDIHRASYCCLSTGNKNEGFYLDRNYCNLLHIHFHPPLTTPICSDNDINTFYLSRKRNIEKAKRSGLKYFINPIFMIFNRSEYNEEELDLLRPFYARKYRGNNNQEVEVNDSISRAFEVAIYYFSKAKSRRDYVMWEHILELDNLNALQENTNVKDFFKTLSFVNKLEY